MSDYDVEEDALSEDKAETWRSLLDGTIKRQQLACGGKRCQCSPGRELRITDIASIILFCLSVVFVISALRISKQCGISIHEELLTVRFMPDELYNPPLRTQESDLAWTSYPTGGYVLINDSARNIAPPSLVRDDLGGMLYSVSGFHQVHCLAIIRNAWFLVLENGPDALDKTEAFPHHPHGDPLAPHVQHCFDYLRQSLLCHADNTLEPFVKSDGFTLTNRGSSGWGAVHQCKSWDSLSKWVEEHDALTHGWEG
ncbi:hypothetical protein F5884DRAFT_689577 [Xylogone sp. PMI_703]|nr:hypothetical protein F5884DRAFT_689577 [Xylogone sp. PMI_703]